MSHRMPTIAALLMSLTSLIHAQSAAVPASGHWEGTIQAPDRNVNIEINLVKNGNGEIAGTIDIPSQQLKGLSLVNVAADEGKSISFQIKGAPGERVFKGTLSADGASMSGEYKQLGYTMPFRLTRTGEPRIEAPVRNLPIAAAFEGTWQATMSVKGVERRLKLTLSNQPDGTASGSLMNVDEGLDIPIGRMTQTAASLTIEAAGGSYTGTLNTDGTELAGTLTQGSMTIPLTFRRP